MEFFKFPPEALKEWAVLDKDPETTDAQLKKWYRTWLTKIQTEVVMNDEPGNLIDTLILQYRVQKKKTQDAKDKFKEEILKEMSQSQKSG